MKTCLDCQFNIHCHHAAGIAMRMIINGMSYDAGLSLFEVKASRCDAYKPKNNKPIRRYHQQLTFKF